VLRPLNLPDAAPEGVAQLVLRPLFPDPAGSRLTLTTWYVCGKKRLKIVTKNCCVNEAHTIQRSVCSAYKSLNATKHAIWSLRDPRADLKKHKDVLQKFRNYFNNGKPYTGYAVAGAYMAQWIDGPNERAHRANAVAHVLWEIIKELEDSDGTLYQCHAKQPEGQPTKQAKMHYFGWTVHVYPFFFAGGHWDGVKVLVHELSQLYAQTTDGIFSAWYIERLEDGKPVYNRTTRKGEEESYDPNINRTGHADTIASFVYNWYIEHKE